MNAEVIYNRFRAAGFTRAGALGMLGNLMAESSLIPNIAQRGMTKLTDTQYTAAADNGLIDFVHDGCGYGLAQFTYYSRKQALLDAAKYAGVSVGDGEFQVQFIIDELLSDFPSVWKVLTTSDNIDECCDLVCSQYERPAVNNFLTRRNFAHQFEKDIPDEPARPKDPVGATFPRDPSVVVLQGVLALNGYWSGDNITGYKSDEFFAALREFISDMEKC